MTNDQANIRKSRVLARLDCAEEAVDALHGAIDRILRSPVPVPPAALRSAVRRISNDALRAASVGELIDGSDPPLAECLTTRRWLSSSLVYANTLQTIGWLAWAQRTLEFRTADHEILLLAAALKDVGLFLLESKYKMHGDRLAIERPADWESHPIHSAALVGGLLDVPTALAALVAAHHERLDGTGFPRELGERSLRDLSRYFALVCRFVDLVDDASLGRDSGNGAFRIDGLPDEVSLAALELQQEVRYGYWDGILAKAFLDALADDLQVRLEERLADAEQQLQLVRRRRLRRDMAHQTPHLRLKDIARQAAPSKRATIK